MFLMCSHLYEASVLRYTFGELNSFFTTQRRSHKTKIVFLMVIKRRMRCRSFRTIHLVIKLLVDVDRAAVADVYDVWLAR